MRRFRLLRLGIAVLGLLAWLCLAASSETASPDVYLYIPRISFTPAEHHCLDCKTFAIVAVMRYYGEHVEFEDICREVGEPPGAVYEDVAFFRRLIEFARSRGFVVENHFWSVDQMAAQVEIGRPVIASHRFGDLPTEPGIVKGFDDSHVWVWGVQEFIQQSNKDSFYTRDEFQTLLEKRDSGTGMMGYVPELFSSATNCLLVYKPGAVVSARSYDIDAVPYSERIRRSGEGGPGVVRTLSLAGQGEMMWSGKFLAGRDKKIEVLVYDDEYVTSSAGEPVIVFAVRLLPRSLGAGSVIQGYTRAEKSVWSIPLGYTFEEVLLPVVHSGNAWTATITILPVAGLEQIVVMWPSDCENRPFFGYEISVVE